MINLYLLFNYRMRLLKKNSFELLKIISNIQVNKVYSLSDLR